MPVPSNSRRRYFWGGLLVLVFVAGGLTLGGRLFDSPDDAPVAPGPSADDVPPRAKRNVDLLQQGYVGSRACRRCHAKICDSYKGHPMANSLAEVTEAAVCEDYQSNTSFATRNGVRYRVERTPAGVFQHEIRTDARGQTVFDQAVRVHYAVGSGQRGRTYLIDRGGLLFASPISWYSTRRRWDLSPGYVSGNHPRFGRRILDGCIVCHAGRVSAAQDADHFRKPPFLEYAIGCERCHGPGERHIAFHNLASPPNGRDPIVNPAALEPRRREAVCNQCHLHGAGRILRRGRTEFDFRPGRDLEDVWTVFVSGERVRRGKTKSVSQVEQMRTSVCFQQSANKLGCISCHDPHGTPPRGERVAFYRQKCNNCHGRDETPACSLPEPARNKPEIRNSCIMCHMPRLEAHDVPHTSQTDHRILKRPAAAEEPEAAGRTESIVAFDHADRRLSRADADRARGLLFARLARRDNDRARAADALKRLLPALEAHDDDVDVLIAVGTCYRILGQSDKARRHWEHALKRDPRNESALERLAVLCHAERNFRSGVKYLDRLFAVNSWRADLYGLHAQMLGHLAEFQRGIRSANRALELDPTQTRIRAWLAETHLRLGNVAESRRHRNVLRRLRASR